MADQFLDPIRDLLEGPIDFEGQKKVDIISTWVLILTGIVAFAIGYIQQDIYLTLYIGLLGTGITFLMVIPPWPAYNEDAESWLKSTQGANQANIVVDGKKVN